MNKNIKIGVSLLSSNLAEVQNECDRIIEGGADFLHFDIMDGHFVDNLTFGAPFIKCIKKKKEYIFDCHLMVSNPEKWVEPIYEAGGDIFTFHIESAKNIKELIKNIKKFKMKCGIAINPKTKIEDIFEYIDMIDVILIMTVNPGFGGQEIIPETFEKIEKIRNLFPNKDIQVDGGINKKNIKLLKKKGANLIVSGSCLLNGNLKENIIFFRDQ